jgi:tRNA dimethylallyltransferase
MSPDEGSVARAPVVITGPTASGKGAVAFALALRTAGEIISMDSMKVYREMDVATAKPPAERRARVAYHLIDIVEPHERFSTGEYLPLALRVIDEIRTRGKTPIVVGGTALYLKAFLEGFQAGPPADASVRSRLLDEAKLVGPEPLHERLRALDPVAALKIHPRDLRRIVRGLEVVEKTGRPQSEEWRWGEKASAPGFGRIFGLEWPREQLYARINERVEAMVARGLFEEAVRLEKRQPPLSPTALQTIGYREVWEGRALGTPDGDIIAGIQQSTRRFAKSQLTWFRKMPVEWIRPSSPWDAVTAAEEILRRLASL